MKVYCGFNDFNKEARTALIDAGMELFINNTGNYPMGEELTKLLEEYDILIIGISSKLTSDMISAVKKPIIIATLSVGLDHIAKEFFTSPLVKVINIRTANSVSVAEHIFALILALNKRVYESNNLVLEGRGHKKNVHERPEDISNKTLGLIGAGNISKEVIKIANAFHMNILCYTKHPLNHKELETCGVSFTSLENVLKESDIVSINIPLNEETKWLISKEKISLLKPTATFINTSRSEVVDIEELIHYADQHDTFYVGLDIDLDSYKELFQQYRMNVIVTPHTAGVSKQAIGRMDLELATSIVKEKDFLN